MVAVLAVLVLFLQLPGPAACPSKAWRFAALALEALDGDPPAELKARSAPAVEAAIIALPDASRRAGHGGSVIPATAPPAGPDVIVGSGVTRAPPHA